MLDQYDRVLCEADASPLPSTLKFERAPNFQQGKL